MDSKVIIIAVIAVVVVAGAGTGVYFLMNNNDDSEKDYTAQELATKFCEDYDGEMGTFTVVEGATDEKASITYTTTTKPLNSSVAGKDRVLNVDIYHYEDSDSAHAAFLDFIENSKNGSKGKTLLTQQDKLGMATVSLTIYDLREEDAGDWGADHAFLFYAAYTTTEDTTAQFTQCAGAIEDGNNVVVFNKTSVLDLYLNKPILDSVGAGVNGITQSDYENVLKEFCKAF